MINNFCIVDNPIIYGILAVVCLTFTCLFKYSKMFNSLLDYYLLTLDKFFTVSSVMLFACLFAYLPVVAMLGVVNMDIRSFYVFLNFCLIHPVSVELVVNGLLARVLDRYCKKWLTVITCSLLIALLQSNVELALPTLLFWIPICYVFVRTHSLVYVIFLHVIINCIVFIVVLTPLLEFLAGVQSVVLGTICFVCFVLYVRVLVKIKI